MALEFELRSAYGTDRYYPKNPAARAICVVAGRKALERRHVELLREHGYTVVAGRFA
jgi:hypothetical protein